MVIALKKLDPSAKTPTHGSADAAGYDLYSLEEYTLKTGERKAFKTGISLSIPKGLYGRVAPRSGLALKEGIDVMAGVIDSDYIGEICVILINLGQNDKKVAFGDKIAQIIFEQHATAEFAEVGQLTETNRGSGGFGNTDTLSIRKPAAAAFNSLVESMPQTGTLEELYKKAGGIPTKKPYSKEIEERQKI